MQIRSHYHRRQHAQRNTPRRPRNMPGNTRLALRSIRRHLLHSKHQRHGNLQVPQRRPPRPKQLPPRTPQRQHQPITHTQRHDTENV